MVDFNKGKEVLNRFLGSEKKTTVLYENDLYMLKFPDPVRNEKIKELLSYKNNQFSEHIGCSIFKMCGFITQETTLGYFTDSAGKEKIVVGCKDFTQHGGTMYEMSKLGNQTAISDTRLSATIENIYLMINSSILIDDKVSIIDGFWDMFVIDTLIGNNDRHFGNWGILDKDGKIGLSPIYDCGSSLGALLDDDEMEKLLSNPVSFRNQEYNIISCYSINGKRIFYHEIYKSPPKELKKAINRIVPKIEVAKIHDLINSTPLISDVRKEYLKKSIDLRYEQIIKPAFEG